MMGTSQFEYVFTPADLGGNTFGYIQGTGGTLTRIAKQGMAMPSEVVVGSDGTTHVTPPSSEGNHDMIIEFEGYNVNSIPTLGLGDSYGDPIRMRWDEAQGLFSTIEYPTGHPRDDLRTWIEARVGQPVRVAITQNDSGT